MAGKLTIPDRPVLGAVPRDVAAARRILRDDVVRRVITAAPEMRAMRARGRFTPARAINVVGVGIGEKVVGGTPSGDLCVKVLVARKYPKSRVGRAELIPATIDGVPTDVEAVGYPRAFAPANQSRHRPVLGGISTGLDAAAVDFEFAGTFGALVVDRDDPEVRYALSNNHVLADENRAPIGAGVVQPGTLDGGSDADRIGRLARFVPMRFDNKRNYMDAAIARLDAKVRAQPQILGIGAPTGAGKPSLGMLVRKSGRTTGLTEGVIRTVRFDVFNIEYEQGMVRVDDTIVIRAAGKGSFSKPGDSGSVIVGPDGKVVALLFAGSTVATFAVPIQRVLKRLAVRLAK